MGNPFFLMVPLLKKYKLPLTQKKPPTHPPTPVLVPHPTPPPRPSCAPSPARRSAAAGTLACRSSAKGTPSASSCGAGSCAASSAAPNPAALAATRVKAGWAEALDRWTAGPFKRLDGGPTAILFCGPLRMNRNRKNIDRQKSSKNNLPTRVGGTPQKDWVVVLVSIFVGV